MVVVSQEMLGIVDEDEDDDVVGAYHHTLWRSDHEIFELERVP